ncbi:MAG: hypothetical protein LBT99_04350 [Bifidobacteriaceae bacterium]|jgi:phosphohistidine phosphatase|nr:hypothetical protein [Bifidobacteriaceae bacterium]
MNDVINHQSNHLLYFRHGKATSTAQSGTDANRTLLEKGKLRVKNTAKIIRDLDLIPELILCSGAKRAMQTLTEITKIFGDMPEVEYKYTLYNQVENDIIALVHQTPDNINTLMLIGHEPSASDISYFFTNKQVSNEHSLNYITSGLSTAECTILESPKPIKQWTENSAKLLGLIRGQIS